MGLAFPKSLFFHSSDVLVSLLSYWYNSHFLRQAINRIINNILKKTHLCFDELCQALPL